MARLGRVGRQRTGTIDDGNDPSGLRSGEPGTSAGSGGPGATSVPGGSGATGGPGTTGGRDTSGRPGATGGRRLKGIRRLPLRTVLLIIVFVPSLTFAPLLASGMNQLVGQYRAERTQMDLFTTGVGEPAADLFFALDRERRLTAEVIAEPTSAARGRLAEQRGVTDRAVRAFRPLTGLDEEDAQEGLADAISRTDSGLAQLAQQRRAVDAGTAGAQRAFDYYSGVLESDLAVLAALSRTDEGQVNRTAQPLVDLYWVLHMIGREDAVLARGWAAGRLTRSEYGLVTDAIGTRNHLMRSRVLPLLTESEASYAKLTDGAEWKTMTALEGRLMTAEGGQATIRDDRGAWRASVDAVTEQLRQLVELRYQLVTDIGNAHARMVFTVFISISSVGLLALGLVIWTSWRLTSILRRRIHALQRDAHELQERLPDVVARLERGEEVDVDREVRLLERTPDELGELGHALNQASRSAVHTAVRQAEQHRGFQRMLQRIARRTQILIGLQLKKLDELERRHEDPEVLEGLFDLDHLTARLRRYEENLVILGGGQPQRRWRKPVPLVDVLRAAQGEVQDYRRISIDVDGDTWIAERAVGPLVHVLAELMENATTFSRPQTPVEVRAAPVSRGVAVEIEDRGLGMEPEQYEAANELLRSPPRLDVMTHAEDVRLGLYVVARLSASLGLRVEMRSSAYGGTRVVVLLPEAILVDRPPSEPRTENKEGELPSRTRGHAMAHATSGAVASPVSPSGVPASGPAASGPVPAGAVPSGREPSGSGPSGTGPSEAGPSGAVPSRSGSSEPAGRRPPLPQRVRQASLAAELKAPVREDRDAFAVRDQPARSGAVIGAFQRQSRRQRSEPAPPTTTEER